MGAVKPPSTHSTGADSAMPGICKELIGQSVSRLRGFSGTEESMADRLVSDLNLVYVAVQSIADLYSSLDDDSQENGESQPKLKSPLLVAVSCGLDLSPVNPAVFACNTMAQTQLVKATAAIESAVFVTTHWLSSARPTSGLLYTIAEELKSQVKKMGGFFQLLIQVKSITRLDQRPPKPTWYL